MAVGYAGVGRPFVVSDTRGVWTQARVVAPPAGVRFTNGEGAADLYSVTCASAGNCVAVGTYTALEGRGPMAISESRGVWGSAYRLALPANATNGRNTPDPTPALLISVACTSRADCVAVGTYNDADVDRSIDSEPMAATETSGAWQRALQVRLPNGVNPAPPTQTSWLTSIACTSPTDCVAVGFYIDTHRNFQGMVVSTNRG